MTDDAKPDFALKQRGFLKDIEKIIPHKTSKLADGDTTLAVTCLGRKRLPNARILEVRLEAKVIGLHTLECG
jgi:hypothetical protein